MLTAGRKSLPFVGRRPERAWLRSLIDGAVEGNPAIILIRGPAGIGRSRMLAEATEMADRRGMRSLAGRCYERLDQPFFPILDALTFHPEDDQVEQGDAVGQQFPTELIGLTRELVGRARRQPTVVTIDDLHHADEPTVRLLQHLAFRLDQSQRAGALPLLIVGTYTAGQEEGLSPAFEELIRESSCYVLELTGLHPLETKQLLVQAGCSDAPPGLYRIGHDLTGGNPLFLEAIASRLSEMNGTTPELGKLLEDLPLPAHVRNLVDRQLGELTDEQQHLLEVMAVVGDEMQLSVLSELVAKGDDEVATLATAAARSGVVDIVDDRVRFASPLHRHRCLPDEGASLVGETRQTLIDLVRHGDDELLETCAGFIVEENDVPPEVVYDVARRAGAAQRTAFSWIEAVRLYSAALASADRLDPRPDPLEVGRIQLALGESLVGAGDFEQGRHHLRAAAATFAAHHADVDLAATLRQTAVLELTLGRFGDALSVDGLEGLVGALEDRRPDLAAEVLAEMAMSLWGSGRLEEAIEAADRADRLGDEANTHGHRLRAGLAKSLCAMTGLELTDAREALERALEADGDRTDVHLVEGARSRLAIIEAMAGRTSVARGIATGVADRLSALDVPWEAEFALAALVGLDFAAGELDRAAGAGYRVQLISRLTGSDWGFWYCWPALVMSQAISGDRIGAESAVRDTSLNGPEHKASQRVLDAWIGTEYRDFRRAEALRHPLFIPSLAEAFPYIAVSLIGPSVEIARAVGRPELVAGASVFLSEQRDRGVVFAPSTQSHLGRLHALALDLEGDPHRALEMLDQALAELEGSENVVERCRALLDRSEIAADLGITVGETAALIAEARSLATAHGLRTLVRRADALLAGKIGRSPIAAGDSDDATIAIVFVDISDSTRLTELWGDNAFRARSRLVESLVRKNTMEAGGRPVLGTNVGDGVLAEFPTIDEAVSTALQSIHQAEEMGLPIHVGMHAGSVIHEDDNIFGAAVNLAARVCDRAAQGELVVSETVRQLADTQNVSFSDRGEHRLKGVRQPVRLFSAQQRRTAGLRSVGGTAATRAR